MQTVDRVEAMRAWCVVLVASLALSQQIFAEYKPPTVLISILVRNKAHTLPYFLTLLQNLNYPKDRVALWIRGDHTIDDSFEIVNKWIDHVKGEYNDINVDLDVGEKWFADEAGPTHWSDRRFWHVINLREKAMQHARYIWADYIWMLDCDVFLTNPDVLKEMIQKNYPVVAPMLKSDGLYSNFWHGMTHDYYYHRTDGYKPILNREEKGCFNVPMIHSSVLIDLRRENSDLLTYNPYKIKKYDGPDDDIIAFAISANRSGIPLMLCNEKTYGFVMVPLDKADPIEQDYQQLVNIKLEVLTEDEPLEVDKIFKNYIKMPDKDKMKFDHIFMINLLRRPERRIRMHKCFDELGLDVETFDAVDGRNINETVLKSIKFLPEYADPYHKRPMTAGEIGCFLSHFYIWEKIVENGYKQSLVLEDDIRFEPFFKVKVLNLMEEGNRLPDWDLIYFGRKRLQEEDEPFYAGSKYLVESTYSYWTLGYALSLQGAKKLLNAKPLEKLLPVDEYLPIMFNKHPQEVWKNHFPNRNLIGLSARPLLLFPTHYTGEEGYISDTEDSVIVDKVHEDL